MTPTQERGFRQRIWARPSWSAYARLLVAVLIILVTIAAFWQVKDNDFVNYDDPPYITENTYVQSGLNSGSIRWAFTNTSAASYWHPLTWLSHMLDCQLYGMSARGHHFTNLLFHLLNTLLLLLFLEKVTRSLWPSAMVAALFALHPLHVESVAWAAERKDVLSTFFWLLTMWAYVYYADRPSLKRYLWVILPFVLGLMAKPMLVTLPLVLLLLDYWPLGRFSVPPVSPLASTQAQTFADTRRLALRLVLEKVPLLALAALFSLLTIITQKQAPLTAIPPDIRVANALISYLIYLKKTVWPVHLAVFYPHPGYGVSWGLAVVAALALLGVSSLVWREAGRRPYLAVGWFWYLITLLPVIGLMQAGEQAMADRFTYVPLIGIFIILAWGALDLTAKRSHRNPALVLAAGLVLSACIILTWRQVGYWRDTKTLFEHANAVTENNHMAYLQLIYAYGEKGKIDENKSMFEKLIKLRPNEKEAYNNLGMAYSNHGNIEEAIAMFQKAIEMDHEFAEAYNNLGIVYAKQGRLSEAAEMFQKAVQLKPDFIEAYNNLAKAYSIQGKTDEAIGMLQKATEISPYFAASYNNLGIEYGTQGKIDEAILMFQKAIRTNPKFAEAYNNLGVAYTNQGKLDEAMAMFAKAIQVQPQFMKAYINLAISYVNQGQGQAAIDILKKAVRLNPDNQEARSMLEQLSW